MPHSWRRISRPMFGVVATLLATAQRAHAGMPGVTLNDLARLRFQAISFFVVVGLASAWGIQKLWNGLRGDFPRLPRLTYRAALGLTTLWGLLFLLVLSMISGARELMTPGAWTRKPDGLTYTLANEAKSEPTAPPTTPDFLAPRRAGLLTLYGRLLEYALDHDGAFPPDLDDPAFEVYRFDPEVPGAKLAYRPGLSRRSIDTPAQPVALEPDVYGGKRLVLMNDGQVLSMTKAEIQALMASMPEATP